MNPFIVAEVIILIAGILLLLAYRKHQKNQEEKATATAINKMAEQILIEHNLDLQRKAQAIDLMRSGNYPSRR